MLEQEFTELSKWRLEKAKKSLAESQNGILNESYEVAANRSYYAVFHAIRSLLALEGIDFKKHSAVISHFRQHYIKTKVFDEEFSDIIGRAFEIRGNADYEDYYLVAKDEVAQQLSDATRFVNAIEAYLKIKYDEK